MRNRFARGMTAIEMTIAIVVVVVVLVIAAVLFSGIGRMREDARTGADSVHIREIQQAMTTWAESNKGLFPLPSVADGQDTTVSAQGAAKDTTANILSLLIYAGGITPAMVISPAESNQNIVEDTDYRFTEPPTAINPSQALWDPAFAADFTDAKVGNTSYAHILPGGGRGARWRQTFSTTEPVCGNRGPEVVSITRDEKGRVLPKYALPESLTLLIHGDRRSWEGCIVYNDGHVQMEVRTDPTGVQYTDAAGKQWTDCLFYDEPDDAAATNVWMSIWTKAGAEKKDFVGIWD